MIDTVRLSATLVFLGSIVMVFISAYVLHIDALVVVSLINCKTAARIRLGPERFNLFLASGFRPNHLPCLYLVYAELCAFVSLLSNLLNINMGYHIQDLHVANPSLGLAQEIL